MLKLKSVYKRFEDAKEDFLQDISLHVQHGEFVSIIAARGVGKTTLLEICAGLQKYHKGLITFDGNPMSKPGLLTFVPKENSLLPWKTVKQNLTFVAKHYLSEAEADAFADELLAEFRMEELAHSWLRNLTTCENRRITLLRAIAYGKDFLLLDEPLSFLGSVCRKHTQGDLINLIKKYNKTVLMTTLNIDEAIFLSDRIYMIHSKEGVEEIITDANTVDKSSRNSKSFRQKYEEIEAGLNDRNAGC